MNVLYKEYFYYTIISLLGLKHMFANLLVILQKFRLHPTTLAFTRGLYELLTRETKRERLYYALNSDKS